MHSSKIRTTRSSSRLPGGCLPQCMLGYPPRCGPGDPPGCEPGDSPPGVGLETPQCEPGDTPPWVWAWRPPTRCGPGDPPQARPLNFPLGCGPGDLQDMLGYHPLDTCKACWDTSCNACLDTTPHQPWTEFLTHVSENITLPQTSFAGGKNLLRDFILASKCLLR